MVDSTELQATVNIARDAMASGRLDDAEAAWRNVRQKFPQAQAGFVGLSQALRRLKRGPEADAVLAEGRRELPRNEKIALEYAWFAHHRGQWPEAVRRWDAVRQDFPDSFDGYYGGAAALRAAHRFDEADALYDVALARWPDAVNMFTDYARSAVERGDRQEAVRRWEALRARFPDDVDSALHEARAWRHAGDRPAAEARLRDAVARFSAKPEFLIELAQIAADHGETVEALKRWDDVATAYPGLKDGYIGAAHALNGLGRFADAQNVLLPALRMFPEDVEIATLNAWIAHYLAEFATAVARWEDLRGRFPGHVLGWTGGAISLSAQGRTAEANELMEDAARRFPDDLNVGIEWARQPQRVQDWDEAERRWRSIAARFPNRPRVAAGLASMLSRNGKSDEAEQVLDAALAAQPGEPGLLRARADCAAARQDWDAAISRWRDMTNLLPGDAGNWCGLAAVLRDAGRMDESEQAAQAALARFPDHIDLQRQLALTATLRRDWTVALPRWDALKRRYPGNPEIRNGIVQAIWQARQDQGVAQAEGHGFDIPPSLLAPEESGHGDAGALQKLFMRFESIGDTCEFGIVQRRFGAEPISLLRWAATRPHNLVIALDTKFEGVGDPEHTVIEALHGEYISRDKRYHMFSHTFTPETSEPLDRFTKAHLRRMQYLRRKLLDDLTEGSDKIYVYKCIYGLSDDEAISVFEALRRYGGTAPLMCVRIADADHPPGTLDTLRSGLYMGYTDRFSTIDINVDVWVSLCRQAASRWDAEAAGQNP